MSMLLFVESMLWSIIGESGFVVSSVVPSAQALLSLHMPTGKLGSRPLATLPKIFEMLAGSLPVGTAHKRG